MSTFSEEINEALLPIETLKKYINELTHNGQLISALGSGTALELIALIEEVIYYREKKQS